MASTLIHSSISPSNVRTQSSFPRPNTVLGFKHSLKLPKGRRTVISLAAVDEKVPSSDSSPPSPPSSSGFELPEIPDITKGDTLKSLKLKLLSVISGLNRGLVASEEDLKKADTAAKKIEEAGGPVDLAADLDKLQGRWKLIYSSAFSSRTLGGSRPGPPIGRLLPITLGQVFQRIDTVSKDFDNVVELELGAPWPLEPIEVTATLAHKFEIIGTSEIKLIFEKTTVKTTGNLSQLPPLEIPQLPEQFRPSTNRGSGEFEVTYLDSDIRITRGDRGSLECLWPRK